VRWPVLISFGAGAVGFRWADTVAAALVAVLIRPHGWSVLGANLGVLADSVRLDRTACARSDAGR